MADNVNLNGTLYPTASASPTHRDIYGEGGYHSVATVAVRDAIPANLKKDGMLVFTQSNNTIYQYDGASFSKYYSPINLLSVTTGMLADFAVTSLKLGPLSVESGKIAAGAVGPGDIGTGGVVAGNIAPNAVEFGNYAANSIAIGDLGPSVVGSFMLSFVDAPSASSAPGVEGTVAFDGSFFYVCLSGGDDWGRTALSGW